MGQRLRISAIVALLVSNVFASPTIADRLWGPAIPTHEFIVGVPPTYTDRKWSDVPNRGAFSRFHWSPGLDDGYVPQGLTVIGNDVFVGTYQSASREQSRGPCRIYRLTQGPDSGFYSAPLSNGHFELPAACGHAGGLARGPGRSLWVADTRVIFEIALGAPDDPTIGKVVRTVQLKGDVRGSFAAGSADAIWLGTYARDGAPRLYKVPFDRLKGKPEISEAEATASLPMPLNAQGAAFDAAGKLWVTRSGSKFGELLRLDPANGTIEARFAMPAGIEDISFDATGRLWSVSEAGSRRWNDWATFYPLVFAIEIAKLK